MSPTPLPISRPQLPPGDLSKRNCVLISLCRWRLVRFSNLPTIVKRSLSEHITGKPPLWGRDLKRYLGPRKLLGLASVPTPLLCLQVMNDPDRRNDWKTFDEYHRWYCLPRKEGRRMIEPKSRWPIILSGRNRDRETILDGWHRFHSYYRQGVRYVPALWYADE